MAIDQTQYEDEAKQTYICRKRDLKYETKKCIQVRLGMATDETQYEDTAKQTCIGSKRDLKNEKKMHPGEAGHGNR